MGKQVHLERVKRMFEKSPVVEFRSIKRIVGVKNAKNNYAKLLVHNLLKKGEIKRIGRGVYTKHSESSLAVFVFNPSYLGLQSALSFYGLWEQETIPVILTTRKVRRGIRKILNSNILVRNIDKKYFFGFEYSKEGDFYLPYSDLEKTFIDMVVFNQEMSKEVVKNVRKRMDKKRFNEYLRRYSGRLKEKIKEALRH